MNGKREEARREAGAQARATKVEHEHARDVMAALRNLGCRADEARRVTEFCMTIPETTLEERMRAALKYLGPKTRSQRPVETSLSMPT
jgi:Holliday junction resolvasome RuvABC DNA-binding subunit